MVMHNTTGKAWRSQHGVALMVMMIIMVLGTALYLVTALNTVGQSIRRDQVSFDALNEAKEALIAYATTQGDIAGTPRPGDLPCPDTNNDGTAEGSCVAGAIGRLPYKTLGMTELIDKEGEKLWYAISGNFRPRSITGTDLNSNTAGTLNVYDSDGATLLTPSSDRAVAVIIAPGITVGSQLRSTSSEQLNAANYLEADPNSPSPNNANNAVTGGPFIAATEGTSFNDKLVYIKASQLRPAIEKRVAGELRKLLETYYTAWNAFPFAVPFTNPNTATFSGSSGTYYGLPPFDPIFGPNTNLPAWNATPTISFSNGGSYLAYCTRRDGSWTNSRWRCCKDSSCSSTNTTIPAGVTVTITGRLNHVGKGFWKPFDITDNVTYQVRARNSSGNTVLASSLLDNVSVTGTLNYSDGSATVVFSGTGKSGGSTLQRIELRDITALSTVFPDWLSANKWEQFMYYATSPGYAPGGAHSCTPYCISLDSKTSSAVVVATSATLTSQTRPSSSLSNYLEGSNLTPASGIYENKTIADNFNDTAISVGP